MNHFQHGYMIKCFNEKYFGGTFTYIIIKYILKSRKVFSWTNMEILPSIASITARYRI